MSVLKEISESHELIKGTCANIFLIPFWYVAIYLFNNEFYVKADTILIFVMCIVISITSSFAALIFIKEDVRENPNNNNYSFLNKMTSIIFCLCVWLIFLIITTYSIGYLFNRYLYFFWFLFIYTVPIPIISICQSLYIKFYISKK